MSWPVLEQTVKGADVSRFQNERDNQVNRELGRIDFAELASQHPDLRIIVSRAAGGNSGVDPDFAYNFDESGATGFDQAAYVNSNPARPVSELVSWWKAAIGPRQPKLIVLDSELTGGQPREKITTHVQDCHKAIRDGWPSAVVALQYSGAWWWDPNIIHGWESDLLVWPAHYPYLVELPNGEWRVAYSFEEVDRLLPIHNGFTPKIPLGFQAQNAAGWQFTSKGILQPITKLPGYLPRVDLDYFQKWFHDQIYGPPAPPPAPPPGTDKFMRDKARELQRIAAELEAKADEL